MSGDPQQVRVGPGWLYIAPVGTDEPDDLDGTFGIDGGTSEPDLSPWVPVGYTNEGSSFTFGATFEDVTVEEELEPIEVLQTARNISVNFAAAELTAANLQTAMNGGEVTTAAGIVTFEPPDAGDYTPVALAWQADDDLERWIFRRCIQVGDADIPRRRAPNKAVIPMQFRVTTPKDGSKSFKFIHADDYTVEEPGGNGNGG
jgi:hypothetical protein